jgi:hypothetical protein
MSAGSVTTRSRCANGFDLKTCPGEKDIQYVLSGDKFVATHGSYTFTIRPAP